MKKINAVLIDDESDSLEALGILLERYCPSVNQLAHCNSARDGLTAIEKHSPDLLFLDIEMPGMSGFELLEELGEHKPEVIFVTAYDQYAIDAIKVSAMDYLLKPVDEEELVETVNRASGRLQRQQTGRQLEILLTNIKGRNGFQKLALPTLEGLNFINVGDILYCEADRNYTTIYCIDGEEYIISRTLKDTAKLLQNSSFFRTHQSYLINLNFIKKYIKGSGGNIVMQDDTVIPVARARKDDLMKMIYK